MEEPNPPLYRDVNEKLVQGVSQSIPLFACSNISRPIECNKRWSNNLDYVIECTKKATKGHADSFFWIFCGINIQTKTLSLIKIDDFHMIVKERKGEFEMDKEKMKRENDLLMNLEE